MLSGLVARDFRIGAWASHIIVTTPEAVEGGRELFGLPAVLGGIRLEAEAEAEAEMVSEMVSEMVLEMVLATVLVVVLEQMYLKLWNGIFKAKLTLIL